MELFERAFRLLPDTVIITDLYWYILDYNHAEAIKELRKGVNLTRIIRDCKDTAKGKFRYNEIIFQRTTTPVYDKGKMPNWRPLSESRPGQMQSWRIICTRQRHWWDMKNSFALPAASMTMRDTQSPN